MDELNGRIALVTGGASGIGRATALLLAREGAAVAVADVDAGGASETVRLLEAVGARAAAVRLDVREEGSVAAGFARAGQALGGVDILVNCAGGQVEPAASGSTGRLLQDLDLGAWERTIRLNLTGTLLCCRAALGGMIERRWGRIVNVGSSSGFRLQAGAGAYGVSKAAIPALTKLLAKEVGLHGVTANCVVPSLTDTPMVRQAFPTEEARKAAVGPGGMLENPLGVVLEAEDPAAAIVFLCRHGRLTGQTLHVNGGHWMP